MCNLKFKAMKKMWKSAVFALALGVGMALPMVSCSDSEGDGPDGPKGGPDDNVPVGYLSFQSAVGDLSRTKANPHEAVGTDAENTVSRVRIILYDQSTHIAEYAFDYSGTVLHSTATAQDFLGTAMLDPNSQIAQDIGYQGLYTDPNRIVFIPKAFKVKQMDYRLLVLVNPNDALVGITKARKEFTSPKDSVLSDVGLSNYDAFYEKTGSGVNNNLTDFIGSQNAGYSPAPGKFLMSNSREYIVVGKNDVKDTEDAAYTSRVRVTVDRAVAKVSTRVDYDRITADVNSNAIVSDGRWLLDITNKSAYWMRHKAAALGGTMENDGTPRSELYATDPNYTDYSHARYLYNGLPVPSTLITSSQADIKNYFNYLTKADFNGVKDYEAKQYKNDDWQNVADYTSEYALENTMEAKEQYEDVTTSVLLKIKYLPKKTSMGNTLGTAGYYVWGRFVLTGTELVAIRDYVPAAIPPAERPKYEMFLELQKYLKDNKTALEGQFGTSYNYSGASVEVGNIQYNSDGLNFYRILIRHFDYDQEATSMAHGRYGVVRNNWYRINVNSIQGPGSIDIPDPEWPDDKQYFLGVEMEVLPWVARDQKEDID